MATTTATVTSEGLALSPDFMERFNLQPGTQIRITLENPSIPADIEQLIRETRGMFAGGPSMAEELMHDRREDDRRSNNKW